VDAPRVLDACLRLKALPGTWLAGQVSGVEGYLESAACGLAASRFMDQAARGLEPVPLPRETVLGALLHYLAHAPGKDFSPVNAMLGLLPEIPEGVIDARTLKRSGGVRALKAGKGAYHRERALAALEAHLSETGL